MLALGALMAIAQAAGEPAFRDFPAESHHRRPECVAVQVTSPQLPRPRAARHVFSATRILDIEFQTMLRRRVQGPHTLQLKLYTPKGHLYQILTVPFTAPGRGEAEGEKPGKRWVDGHPEPVDEQEAQAVRFEGFHRHQVNAILPVAGTLITNNSLYGQWRVEPQLDDDPEPCGPPESFFIKP